MAKKTTKTKKTGDPKPEPTEPEIVVAPEIAIPQAKIEDPIGDETDGEAKAALEPEIAAEVSPGPEGSPELEDGSEPDEDEDVPEFSPKSRPPANLERLQKILAKAGVASRRKAEELIEQGRVQVNGTVVTELGTKADAGRDHIRVDGKLLQGAERLRYFVLNKPRGFVTTVKDPEGRPTVMQFFDKMRERLYPVGRLDYMSEGLLLVTNDGELANRLTRAAAGVEKTYLVKVAGIPSEAELDLLRSGVAIERGKPGSERVRTSPARIRQVRQGDNPWYEVVLIEGRNRELRKMFEEVGHFVEKIRRVGYGPLILDQEPGNLRELDSDELDLLRQAAEGKLRTPKSKDVRRRNLIDAGKLPTVAPRATGARPTRPIAAKPFAAKSFDERPAPGPKDYRPKKSFAENPNRDRANARPSRPPSGEFRPPHSTGEGYRPAVRPAGRPAWQKDDRTSRPAPGKPFGERPAAGRTYGAKPPQARAYGDKPASRPYGSKPATGGNYREKPATGRPFGDKPAPARTFAPKPPSGKPNKPAWKKPAAQEWPPYKRPPADRPAAPRREPNTRDEDFGPVRPPNLHIEEIKGSDRPAPSRSSALRPYSGRPSAPRSRPDRPASDRFSSSHAGPGRSSSGRPSSAKPFRSEGGLARPFTTSSGKPRAGGARPSSKPGTKPAGRTYGAGPSRPFEGKSSGPAKRPFRRDASEGSFTPRPPGKPGWKPRPSFGGPGKPASSARSKPRSGSSKSGYKGKPGGPKRAGSSGGKKRG
jgi:pseudouridine synthase